MSMPMIPQQSVIMNPSIPLHAQVQYQGMQSQPPAFHYRPQLRMPQPALTPSPGEVGFDNRMLRKAMARKTVDYNSSVNQYLESRRFTKTQIIQEQLQPDILFAPQILPPLGMLDNPANSVTTKFIRPATNKNRCPVFCVRWTPDGRRLITGASSGEFTLWNGLTFNFETILQAHETSIRAMIWSNNEHWMLTGDQNGFIKYWQTNMNNVKMFQAHKEPVRGLSFCPTDEKFATCSDDSSVRILDFTRCKEECALRGHGSEVRCVDWHPHKGIVISGSKDSQQPIILWDPRGGKRILTLRAHKNACTDLQWNRLNGNWLLSASRDHLCKLFDVRWLNREMQCFRGHKKETNSVSWHPIHEGMFSSGGSDGSLYFWLVGSSSALACMDDAHESVIWDMSWHPLGHMLVTGSNDHTTRFWTRNRPGDTLIEKSSEEVIDTPKFEVLPAFESFDNLPGLGNDNSTLSKLRQQRAEAEFKASKAATGDNMSSFPRNEDLKRKKQATFSKPLARLFEKTWSTGEMRLPTNFDSGVIYNPNASPITPVWRPQSHQTFNSPRALNSPGASGAAETPSSMRPGALLPSHHKWVSPASFPAENGHFPVDSESSVLKDPHRHRGSISESDRFFGAFRKRSPSVDRHLGSPLGSQSRSPTEQHCWSGRNWRGGFDCVRPAFQRSTRWHHPEPKRARLGPRQFARRPINPSDGAKPRY